MLRYILLIAAIMPGVYSLRAADTSTQTFNERIRTLQVQVEGDEFADPVIVLNTSDRIVISFDHLAEDRSYLRYELVHCNADWQPSGLVDSEFLDGFNLGNIEDYDYAQMTLTHYVHYTLTIPNAEVSPKISGNYLLRVYPEHDPDDIWLQCRFMVSEQTAVITGLVSTVTDIDYNDRHQQLALTIDTEHSQVVDPFNDLTVSVMQNSRLDTERHLRQPMRMSGRYLSVYEHMPALIYDAGNEYRRFETVSTIYPGMSIEAIEYHEPYYHMVLGQDTPRAGQMYLYDSTQHGAYRIREYNSSMSDIEADYVVVHFALDHPQLDDALIFIDGDLTDRRFDDNALMTYNHATGRYERNMLLKQGAYNYQYLVVPNGSSRGLTAPIEGDKYQTDNRYSIKVYARHPGDRYDRLIGTSVIYSNQ